MPQLDVSPPDVDIVTLTAGGNDLGYSKGMIIDAFRASLRESPVLGRALWATGLIDKNAHAGDVTFDQVKQRFLEIFDRVHAAAPKAKIYLVQYLDVFGPDTDVQFDQPLNKERSDYYRSIAHSLASIHRDAAALRKDFVQVVEMSEISKGHALGSEEPWVTGFIDTMMITTSTQRYGTRCCRPGVGEKDQRYHYTAIIDHITRLSLYVVMDMSV